MTVVLGIALVMAGIAVGFAAAMVFKGSGRLSAYEDGYRCGLEHGRSGCDNEGYKID